MTNEADLIVPSLELLPKALNHFLSGEEGSNRETHHRCQINAKNDYEALQCWLNEYRHKHTTFRTYQKETERFLLWAVFQKKKALSSLDRDDMEEYLHFLDDPHPREIWCAKKTGRGCRRGDPTWRPFTGPLSTTAKKAAISSIDSLLSYLVDARYLAFNPLSLMRKRHSKMHSVNASMITLQERMLTIEEWDALLDTMENYPETTKKERDEKARLKFIVNILFFLGLRINELVTHNWDAFRQIENDWWFYVVGKGDKVGRIPVNDGLLKAVITYRAYLKKTLYPNINEVDPLIMTIKSGKAITARHVNKILKKLAMEATKKFLNQPDKVKKLKKFSAHWLRHFSASMQDRAGILFKHLRENMRHENDETTRRYVHAIDRDRHQDMQKMKLRIK